MEFDPGNLTADRKAIQQTWHPVARRAEIRGGSNRRRGPTRYKHKMFKKERCIEFYCWPEFLLLVGVLLLLNYFNDLTDPTWAKHGVVCWITHKDNLSVAEVIKGFAVYFVGTGDWYL